MKRLFSLTAADMRFQFRYGFYALYLFVSVLYIVVISLLPVSWRETARVLTVFSDPAALGLFFMGAILLFEKGERVLPSLAVSPMRTGEYVAAKVISLALVSILSGVAIFLAGGGSVSLWFIVGVAGGSGLFTLTGIAIGARIRSLNQFLIATVPAEILIFVPAILFYFGVGPAWFVFHPGVAIMRLLKSVPDRPYFSVAVLAFWLVAASIFARTAAARLFRGPHEKKEVTV